MYYIKRKDVLDILDNHIMHCFSVNDSYGQNTADAIEDDILLLPTVDAVEVCRCKDCRYTDYIESFDEYYCSKGYGLKRADDFCSKGKKSG